MPSTEHGLRPFDPEALLQLVEREAKTLKSAGFDALLVENFGDAPFLKDRLEPHTTALLALTARRARIATGLPVGVNALRNDARGAIGAAVASGSQFVRINVHVGAAVTDQGIIEGQAAQSLRYRASLSATTMILADVNVKHARPLAPTDIEQATRDCLDRGRADAVIVTGAATAQAPLLHDLRRVARAAAPRPVLVGSGADPENAVRLADEADGIIVSSSLRRGGRPGEPLDERRVRAFAEAMGRG